MGGKHQFADWQRVAAEEGYVSYAVDLRGHHESPAPALAKTSLDDYAEDVTSVLSEIGPAYLVGHSMGGLVCQMMASKDMRVKKLVIVASAPPAGIVYVNGVVLGGFKYLVAAFLGRPYTLTRTEARRFFLNKLPEESYDSLVPDSPRAAVGMPLMKIGKIDCPVLVIAGAEDRAVPVSVEKRLARKYGAEYAEFPNMGHMLMLEKDWEQPIRAILRWLGA